ICWAWINFSWFSSAYDTDDWVFRIVTMVQMIGVLVLATGLPRMFASVERSGPIDNSVMVLGYVIMRAALVFQWARAARGDLARRRACLTYAATISIAQIGWVIQIAYRLSSTVAITLGVILVFIEMTGPVLAERQAGGTPWHALHIAERHSLFAIVALGEGVVGTVAALSVVVERQGWTLDAMLVGVAGMGLTFGMWWVYFLEPSAKILQRHRERALLWGFLQILIVTSIVATGAGLRVATSFLDGAAKLPGVATVLAVAVPVAMYLLLLHAQHCYLVRSFGAIGTWLLIASAGLAVLSVAAALAGVSMPACLMIVMLAPALTVVVSEMFQRRDAPKVDAVLAGG
ncbi:MAG TPA: low temperature requirement protein A, partial [Thermoanaerobaculia bacterium]|nr:low temperature requirement protein A [Thermoanaerobaculia bacterium]